MVLSRLSRLFDFIWPLSNESFLAQYIILLSNDCGRCFIFIFSGCTVCHMLMFVSFFLLFLSALEDLYCSSAT